LKNTDFKIIKEKPDTEPVVDLSLSFQSERTCRFKIFP